MLEYPEIKTIVRQMENEIIGKTVAYGTLEKRNGNMFMNAAHVAQYSLFSGGTVVKIDCLAPDIYIMLDNGYGILICQSGGKILYNKTPSDAPKNFNIIFGFSDSSSMTYTMSLFTLGFFAVSHDEWQKRKQSSQKFDPLGDHSFDDYMDFVRQCAVDELKKPIKTFLATNMLGVMSTYAAEILLYAKIYPSTQVRKLDEDESRRVYDTMKRVLSEAVAAGGKNSEFNLFGKKGGYLAMAERKHIGENCPVCDSTLEKNSTAGVTAFCPKCQIKKA